MDGPRDDCTKWSKSDRERQIYITYMWILKEWYQWNYLQNKNRHTNIGNKHGYQRGRGWGRDKLGVWD